MKTLKLSLRDVLLAIRKIPLIHFADEVKIFGDRLYILEKDNEMCVYEYRIMEDVPK